MTDRTNGDTPSAIWDTAEFRCSCGTELTAHTPAQFEQLITDHMAACTYRAPRAMVALTTPENAA